MEPKKKKRPVQSQWASLRRALADKSRMTFAMNHGAQKKRERPVPNSGRENRCSHESWSKKKKERPVQPQWASLRRALSEQSETTIAMNPGALLAKATWRSLLRTH